MNHDDATDDVPIEFQKPFKSTAPATGQSPRGEDWVSKALAGAEEGVRDETALAIFGKLWRDGHSKETILLILHDYADRCSPPWDPTTDSPPKTIEQKVDYWSQYPRNEPEPPSKGEPEWTLAETLDAIVELYMKYVVMTPVQAAAIALWGVHTWAHKVCDTTPYMSIRSVEIRSGKTTCLLLAEELVWKGQLTTNISTAALVRFVEKGCSVLIDEIDNLFKDKNADKTLIGIINSGYRRKGGYTRMTGPNMDIPHTFPTFSPKMFAGLGTLWPSIEDRCIPIRLNRKKKNEKRAKLKERIYAPECKVIFEQIEKWAPLARDQLGTAIPQSPKELNDRQEDCWEPLLNIAELAGERWAKIAWDAAVELSDVEQEISQGIVLLTDIRTLFEAHKVDHFYTKELVPLLNDIEDSPWGNMRNGVGISAQTLASKLRGYEIRKSGSKGFRSGKDNSKGYKKEWFLNAWDTYCEPLEGGDSSDTSDTPKLDRSYTQVDTTLPKTTALNGYVSTSTQIQSVADVSTVSTPAGGTQGETYVEKVARAARRQEGLRE
jgi:hypothetical protein